MKKLLIALSVFTLVNVAHAADIVIDAGELGIITVPDRVDADGFDVQVTLRAWLDEIYDVENAGGNYLNRIKNAFKMIGKEGVQAGFRDYKRLQKILAAEQAYMVEKQTAEEYTGDEVAE